MKLMAQAQLVNLITLSDIQQQVLNGALLGDGCLYLHKNGINANFQYLSKSLQHTTYIGKFFQEYWSGEGIKTTTYFDKRTNKEYTRSTVKTYTNKTFTEQYYKWYIQGIKHIPNDLILTPLTCLIWYLGDGGICHCNRSEYIKLSTQCFLQEEQEKILLPQLQQFEATLMKAGINNDGKQQFFIYIPHRKEQDFLNYIGECPFQDYSYKWQITIYKNIVPKNHTKKEEIFCQLYKEGQTYYQIAKKFNIEPNAVKYYLIKNNLYKHNNNNNNTVIQYKNNNAINIFASGAEASRQLGISNSSISNVCFGRSKSAGGYNWKKYKNLSIEEQQEIQNQFIEYFNKERS